MNSVSFIIPTRNRPDVLRQTLDRLSELDNVAERLLEVVVIDNASDMPPALPRVLRNGVRASIIRLGENRSASARNVGALHARGDWLVMLDDDSHPLDGAGLLTAIDGATSDVAAVAAEIFLPPARCDGRIVHESGGLPEVLIGCGAAIRREVFMSAGGYDPSFDYYAEEYDLSAKLILAGRRIAFDPRFSVLHRKVPGHRDFGRIIRRLVRNNGWVARRYAPIDRRAAELRETVTRYWRIARKERAVAGYLAGLCELMTTLSDQPARPMPTDLWDRFTGLAHARQALRAHARLGRVAIIAPGKNAWCVRAAVTEHPGMDAIVSNASEADTLVIGTMSPGPMLDALHQATRMNPGARVIAPWLEAAARASADPVCACTGAVLAA